MSPSENRMMTSIVCGILLIVLISIASACGASDASTSSRNTETPMAEATPGLVVYGVVRDADGKGVENVGIYRSYASYPSELIATTDAKGEYQSDFYYIPGDEMVTVKAVISGIEFKPAYYYWRHYYGYEKAECNFSSQR